jgi:DNA polymerase-3 subunit delta'
MSDETSEANSPQPIANSILQGHSDPEAHFLNSFNAKTLHHAWLICGPSGIGKATLAYRIARFILTYGASSHDGPGLFGNDLKPLVPTNMVTDIKDPVCSRIISGGHPDFLNIVRTIDQKTGKRRKEITVNEVRAIGSFLSKTSAEGGWRVIVIDSADDLNSNAANAVLKVLEEPPRQSLILLVSHNPGRLLPTIRSRCRRLSLQSLSKSDMCDLLSHYMHEITPAEAAKLANISDGSIGRALDLSRDGGLEIFREINHILTNLPVIDIPRLHKLGDTLARDNSDELFNHAFGIINIWLINVIKKSIIKSNRSLDPLIMVWENTGQLFRQAKGLNLDRKQIILNTFLSIENAIKY